MTSLNGWWQSNDLGARATYDVSETRPRGQKRMLVFGDSYAAGSRLPHEEMWSTVLDLENEGLEVVNLGVDGYGVGQSFLRYQLVEDNVEHDIVLLVFVPDASLWRDINTRRDLGGDWKLFWVMPRFIVEGNELKLIKRITEAGTNDDKRRTDATADELRTHLRLYDRFYFRSEYEEPWLIGKSVIYKLLAKAYYEYQRTKLTNSCLDPESEALQVSEEIIEAMRERVRQDGRELVLAFLPTHRELELLERSTTYRDNWDTMILSVCQPDSVCVDLSRNLRKLPKDQLDSGYDGTHYGPRVNQLIAGLIEAHLEREGLLVRCDG